jgi:lipopolysaccharide export system permease protein
MESMIEKMPAKERRPLAGLLATLDFRNTLSRYILREHIGPFLFAFVIITFILIIDFVPQLVDMIVGRKLPAIIIFKVFIYQIGWMIALSVPMAVLVATLMAFGRMTADLEITAIKSSGVHILRVIYPVLMASCVIAVGLTFFNNDVLPVMNHRARVLMQDVMRMRPTLKIRSGAFVTDIPGYIILIDKVDYNTSEMTGVKILEMDKKNKAPRTIVAKRGFLSYANNGKDLIFDLSDGEIHEFDEKSKENYRRLGFTTQRIVVSEVSNEFQESDDQFRNDREKSSEEMLHDIMKGQQAMVPYRQKITSVVDEQLAQYFSNTTRPAKDTISQLFAALGNIAKEEESNYRVISRENEGIATQKSLIDSLDVEVYKKYSLPTACIVFILIGAPLGILARRGSMGISIGISLGLFIMYWAFLIGGEDLADKGIIEPFWAMWTADILIGIAGLYLIYVVSTEKSLWTVFILKRPSVRRPA